MPPLRWGIASSGRICHDFVLALSTLPPTDHQVLAVAARSLPSAKTFAQTHSIPQFAEGYASLAQNPSIDVVYIGSINRTHFEIAKSMLEAGKHVLVEKPMCINAAQARELISIASVHKRFLMEALWSRCFPSYAHIAERLRSGALGEISRVEAALCFDIPSIRAAESRRICGGVIMDLAIYPLQIALFVFGVSPEKVLATVKVNEDGVDEDLTMELRFPGGGVAKLESSAVRNAPGKASIRGSKGEIVMDNFWACDRLVDSDGSVMEWPLPVPSKNLTFNLSNSCGLRYEAEEVRKCILDGRLESSLVPHRLTIELAKLEDQLRKIAGIRFEDE